MKNSIPVRILAFACFGLIALALLLLSPQPYGREALAQQPPGTQPPTQQEQNLFNAKLARLQANAASMPVGVGDAISSLTQTVTKPIICPEDSLRTSVTVNITTTHVRWNANLAVANTVGTYRWNTSTAVVDNAKTITAQNWVMLDPVVMAADEANPPLGTLADEGLLYHELLHGQLQINAMDTQAWKNSACDSVFTDAADGGHTQINPSVGGYFTNRAPGINVEVVEPPAQQANATGEFTIDVGPTTKETWTWEVLFPSEGGNVQNITVTKENGRFKVKGELIDKTKPGKFLIRIDPPTEWIFGGIENLLVVLPPSVGGITELLVDDADSPASASAGSGSSLPYAALAGGIAAGALALVASGWYVRRRWLR